MTTIYEDYDDEPEDIFLSLPEDLAAQFYSLEMDGFEEDIIFYKPLLPKQGSILEMGCGTGRLARRLSHTYRTVIGIDISFPMLKIATKKSHPNCKFLSMDMIRPAFTTNFDTIIIPYNTLNLLINKEQIMKCLRGCRRYLQPGGKLLVQLFVPTNDFTGDDKKTFQFQMFDRPQGGKIIKEILKKYCPQSESISVEERFRVRPMQSGQANTDWNTTYTIAGFSAKKWLSLFNQAGFSTSRIYGDYQGSTYNSATSSSLLASFAVQ